MVFVFDSFSSFPFLNFTAISCCETRWDGEYFFYVEFGNNFMVFGHFQDYEMLCLTG